ncbi:MAG: ribosome maturation factor RimP, partial [Stenotrophobium sp.]
VKAAHYERFIGQQVKVQLLAPRSGSSRRKFSGSIIRVSDHSVALDTTDGPLEFEFSEIERARLVPDYERESAGS